MAPICDVIIVGGGAAGLLCGAYAAKGGRSVTIVEKMDRPARKLLITGKGRCNLTNNCTADEFIRAVRRNGRFLYSAINAFSPQDTMDLFGSLGVSLKTERGNRVFPQSDKAVEIVDALVGFAQSSGVKLRQAECRSILVKDGKAAGIITEDGETIAGKKVVVATGGKSYPLTGSTGDGYQFAQECGHTVVPPRPSLIPVVVAEKWCRDLMGLSLKNVTLTVRQEGKKKPVFSELGEMLFTHFGVSGPLVLSASAHMEGELSAYKMYVDLKPGLDPAQLDARLLRDFSENLNRDFLNSLGALLPRKLIPVAVMLSGVSGTTKVHQITKEQRAAFVALLKGLPLTPKAFRPVEEAVVTAGGVKVSEINPKTMESKLVEGLYFAGEVLDLDAYTGGFNLQIAFSTGYLAARSLLESM